MELKHNPTRVLMSDVLKDTLPELDEGQINLLSEQYVHVVAERIVGQKLEPITGILSSALFAAVNPEIEFKVLLKEAFDVIEASDQTFNGFQLQHGTRNIDMTGPFTVKAARVQDIDPELQTCVLALQLERLKKKA